MHKPFLVPAVYILVENSLKELLLLERKNTGYKDGEFTLPAGHVEKNETIIEAATRELFEETGLIFIPTNSQLLHVMTRRINDEKSYVDFYIKALSWEGTAQIIEQNKAARLIWVSRDTLPSNIIDHVGIALEYIDQKVISSKLT